MNFNEAKEYVDSLNKFGSVLGLSNIFKLLEKLNNPQKDLKVIHVAGTNGKGSTITYVESILLEAGYSVAKYTSPVVFEYLEKYQINAKNASEVCYVKAVRDVQKAMDELSIEGVYPTIFEVETAIAFLIFKSENVDVAIIETGMGGDTDATNVFDNVLAAVITSISFDHMQFLGNTITEIATHKAGIIVRNCPVIQSVMQNEIATEAFSAVEKVAKEKKAPLYIAKKVVNGCYVTSSGVEFKDISTTMKGEYQNENIALAIETIFALNENYSEQFNIDKKIITDGIRKANISGRFEKLGDSPLEYIDGAHNPDAVEKLIKTINIIVNENNLKRVVLIMGVLADKDYKTECKMLAELVSERICVGIITVTPNNVRGLDGSILASTFREFIEDSDIIETSDVNKARECAMGREPDLIVALGSLSYLSEYRSKR